MKASDLSPDQRVVYQAILDWSASKPDGLLTTGGFAGCLSGDTIIRYNRGQRLNTRELTLRDLYLKFNGYASRDVWKDLTVPTYMPSLWPEGRVALNRVVAVFESGIKRTKRLQLSEDRQLILTADHPVAVPGGAFVKAGDLSRGDRVLAIGTMLTSPGGGRRLDLRPPRVIVSVKHHPTAPKKTVWCNGIAYQYGRVARARLVVEAAMNELPYEEYLHCLKHNPGVSATFKTLSYKLEVHHVDENTLNDDISNLEVLPKAEHARIHGRENEKHFKKDYTKELRILRCHDYSEEMTYDVQMEPPANNFVANGVFVHNTGKSTLLSVFAAETKLQVAYVCLTGRASSGLRAKLKANGARFEEQVAPPEGLQKRADAGKRIKDELLERYAFDTPKSNYVGTIHSLLYRPVIDEETEELKGWVKRETLDRDYDLLVVDEASMVDEGIQRDLQSYGKPILFVGDHGQLPPVMGSGALMKNPQLRLEKIHRQAEGNPIIAMSKVIRETGDLAPSRFDGRGGIRFYRREKADAIEALFREARLNDALPDVGALCWTNKTRIRLNALARKGAGFRGCPNLGEMVICLKNAPPLFNGMRGRLLEAGNLEGFLVKARASFKEEGLIENLSMNAAQFNRERVFSSLEELQERIPGVFSMKKAGHFFDYGYSLTTHKSQGSQWPHVILYVDRPVEPESEDWRRWAYTSVTRSSERLTVFA